MASQNLELNFGEPVTFRGSLPSARAPQSAAAYHLAVERAERLAAELARAQEEIARAKTADAKKDNEAKVGRALIDALHGKPIAMDDYDAAVQLQEQLDSLQRANKDIREQVSALFAQVQGQEADIASKDDQIAALQSETTTLKASFADLKQKLDDQVQATQQVDSLLNKAYADLQRTETDFRAAAKARDDAQASQKETELELHSLHIQWEQARDTIKELESQTMAMNDLERENAALQDDLDELRKQMGDHDRTVSVKDARIQHLESQYQKALEGKLSAEAAASAAAAPTSEPQIYTGVEDSLEAELAATSDYGDDDSVFQHLDYSGITEIADIAPSDAPRLSIGVVQSPSGAPVVLHTASSFVQTDGRELATASTQTDAPKNSSIAIQTDVPKLTSGIIHTAAIDVAPIEPKKAASTTAETQTDTPKVTYGIVHSAGVDIAPIEPKKALSTSAAQTDVTLSDDSVSAISTQTDGDALAVRNLSTTAAQTNIVNPIIRKTDVNTIFDIWPLKTDPVRLPTSGPAVSMQTEPIVEETPEPTVISVVSAPKKKGVLSMYQILALLFALISFVLCAQLQAFKTANGYGYHSRHGYSRGAFGQGRYFLGFVPVGFDIGQDWLSETICRQTSTAIASFEAWAGVTPTPHY